MSISELSDSTQDYLKVIWSLGEWTDQPATTGEIAQRIGVTPATVSAGVRKLAAQGLVEHQRYGSITLTPKGRELALAIVRRHRLVETFLVQVLHYRWDQVHEDAEQMEHAVSDFMIERLDDLLGHPTRDPHGDPIPSPDGHIDRPDTILLTEALPDATVRLEQISDEDATLLQELADCGLGIGTAVTIVPQAQFDTSTALDFGDGQTLVLGPEAARSVRVSVVGKDGSPTPPSH